MQLTTLLHAAVERGASDLLLARGAAPTLRLHGDLVPLEGEPLTPAMLEELCGGVLTPEQRERLQAHKDVDFGIAVPELGRFRLNIHCQKQSFAAAIRYIPDRIPAWDTLGLPPVIEDLTHLEHGLVLVTGGTGSGKSTTLAAMISRINNRDAKHIITLEDPIEFQHPHGKSLVEQREIGVDCPSFASGLKHVLRQDPDVILVGELRDLDTIRTALQAAETGHLVFATLHSSTAAGTIDRIVEVFPADEQAQIRTHLAESLKAVVTQRLLPAAGGKGRVLAMEILISNRPVQTSIREGTTHLISGIMSTSRKAGMQTFEQTLQQLVLNGRIDENLLKPE